MKNINHRMGELICMIQLKRSVKQKIVSILLLFIIASTGGGCDFDSFLFASMQKLKVYSNEELVTSISFKDLTKTNEKADEKIANVDTYKQLLSILYSMNIFPNEEHKTFWNIIDKGEILTESSNSNESFNNTNHSETNTQVSGVDEADIIKNDGHYIYYLRDGMLSIINTSKELPDIVSKTMISDNYKSFYDMYISDDILVVCGGKYVDFNNRSDDSKSYSDYSDIVETNYANPLNFFTVYAVYDISNRKNPILKRTIEIEGSEVSSRLIGDNLYFVTNKEIPYISDFSVNDYKILPMYKDTADSTEIKIIQPANILYFPDSIDAQYMLVGTLDITKNDVVVPQAYLGSGSNIYMNTHSLYISREKNQPRYVQESLSSEAVAFSLTTEIYRFAIDGMDIKFVGIAEVDGYLINQYSMDEYNGILRVASGNYSYGNGITTIDINTMKPIASISGLAVDERIYSVRFMGDVGYMVTYRNVDPLFVFDLSDPSKPLKTGELEIPGFSQYLHPVGDKYLVGFGRNTEERFYLDEAGKKVSTGSTKDLGFKISLFDVSNLYNPKEVFVKAYLEGSYSPASYNPQSIMVDVKNNLFAFPIFIDDYRYENRRYGTVVMISPSSEFITLTDVDVITNNIHDARFCYTNGKLYFLTDSVIAVYRYPECSFINQVSY